MKAAYVYDVKTDLALEEEVLGKDISLEVIPCKTEEDLIQNIQHIDAVICAYEPFTRKVIENLPNLKLIAYKSIGFSTCDLDAARERGIAVTNIPNYCIHEVADQTVLFMLSISRRLLDFNRSVQEAGEWNCFLCEDMVRFGENTVGLLGLGSIPRLVAKRLQGFGPKVLAYDPYVSQEMASGYGVTMVTAEELYQNSDFISCHIPLMPQTEKMINAEAFAKMKDGVVFINTARGKVVDEEALIKALDQKKVSYAALDVLSEEHPDIRNHPLWNRKNVILTPHMAFYSQSSNRDARVHVAENVYHYLKGNYEKCSIVNGVNK